MIGLICFLLFILIAFMLYKMNYSNKKDEQLEVNINKPSENLSPPHLTMVLSSLPEYKYPLNSIRHHIE
jgi:hypothetical protein